MTISWTKPPVLLIELSAALWWEIAAARLDLMDDSTPTTRLRLWLWLIRVIVVIAPRSLRANSQRIST